MSDLLYYEDFAVGLEGEHGPYEVTAEEIKAFAAAWDPQPFHLDEAAARASLMGALCASGWHVCAIMNRLLVDGYVNRSAGLGSFGLEEVKWLRPVHAGDRLTLRWRVLERRVSARRPEMGIVTLRWHLVADDGVVKTEATGANLFRVRGA